MGFAESVALPIEFFVTIEANERRIDPLTNSHQYHCRGTILYQSVKIEFRGFKSSRFDHFPWLIWLIGKPELPVSASSTRDKLVEAIDQAVTEWWKEELPLVDQRLQLIEGGNNQSSNLPAVMTVSAMLLASGVWLYRVLRRHNSS